MQRIQLQHGLTNDQAAAKSKRWWRTQGCRALIPPKEELAERLTQWREQYHQAVGGADQANLWTANTVRVHGQVMALVNDGKVSGAYVV